MLVHLCNLTPMVVVSQRGFVFLFGGFTNKQAVCVGMLNCFASCVLYGVYKCVQSSTADPGAGYAN